MAGAVVRVLAFVTMRHSLMTITCEGGMESTCLEKARESLAAD